jgi:delta-aminolevulinic acid dehydratase/porphobilinogen synthase
MIKQKKKTMSRRRIPFFKIILSNGATYEQVKSNPQVRKVVIEEVVTAIKEGVKKNRKSVSLFEIHDSGMLLELERNNWKVSLESALTFFIEKEDYTKCIEVRDLIKQIQ